MSPEATDIRTPRPRTLLDDDDRVLIDGRAVAAMCSVAPRTVERWRERNMGPAFVKLDSGRIRYTVADVRAWLRSRRVVPRRA